MTTHTDIETLRRLAAGQSGRFAFGQATGLGISSGQLTNWLRAGWIIRRLPKVYALGSDIPSYEASLWEAILYAGPGAMLSHATAAHWRKLLSYPPRLVEVSTPRKIASLPGIRVHARRRSPTRESVRGMPVATVAQILLDLSADPRNDKLILHAMAQLDFNGELSFNEMMAITGKGRLGTNRLRLLLKDHDPKLAQLGGNYEEIFYDGLVARKITPLPQLNVTITEGITVDAAWIKARLIVEIDDYQGHHTPAQLARDARRDLTCRGLGFVVVRYRDVQLLHDPDAVYADVIEQLRRRAA
jgi:hypothetical protein